MILKKLAAPLINEKILQEAEHCYVATAAISEAGFDFIRSRQSPKCKIEIVTGLDVLSSPAILRKIWRHLHDRITLRVYTRNFFHANAYIFDLPYRKSVAFTGTGTLTLEGLKDNEEIFNKITDLKEIEALKSWFTGYFEFAETITEQMVQEYEQIYPSLKQHDIASRQEKATMIALTTGGFNWDTIRFKHQLFKKEDYLTLSNANAILDTNEARLQRNDLREKFAQLYLLLKDAFARLGWYASPDILTLVSSERVHHPGRKFRSPWIDHSMHHGQENEMTLRVILQQKAVGLWLMGEPGAGAGTREAFQAKMQEEEYRATFCRLLTALGSGYWIEVAGDRKTVDTFQNEAMLADFIKTDDWRYYAFVIGRNYLPGDAAINTDAIAGTLTTEAGKLTPLYRHLLPVVVPRNEQRLPAPGL